MTKTINLGLTDELAQKMEGYPEVNWSAVAREAIEKYIEQRSSEGLEAAISIVREMKSKAFAEGHEYVLKNISKFSLGELQAFAGSFWKEQDQREKIKMGDMEPEEFESPDYRKLEEIFYSIELGVEAAGVIISTDYIDGMREAAAKVLEKSR